MHKAGERMTLTDPSVMGDSGRGEKKHLLLNVPSAVEWKVLASGLPPGLWGIWLPSIGEV